MSLPRWSGIFPVVTTKFKANEELDHAETEKHYAFQIDAGVNSSVTCGSVDEVSTFSFEEKLDVTGVAIKVANKRVLRFVEQAAKLGVLGFMGMPSLLYAADAREAKDNLRAIADAAQLPIMVYNNKVTYKVDLTPEDIQDLSDCKWITAIKESTDNIRHRFHF